jgi:hypothetical protein
MGVPIISKYRLPAEPNRRRIAAKRKRPALRAERFS